MEFSCAATLRSDRLHDLIDGCGGCPARPGKVVHVDETRVVVCVGLLGGGVLDFVNRFMTDNPGCVE